MIKQIIKVLPKNGKNPYNAAHAVTGVIPGHLQHKTSDISIFLFLVIAAIDISEFEILVK